MFCTIQNIVFSLVIMLNSLLTSDSYLSAVTTVSEKSYSITLKGRDFQNGSGIPSHMLLLPQGVKVMLTVRSRYMAMRYHYYEKCGEIFETRKCSYLMTQFQFSN